MTNKQEIPCLRCGKCCHFNIGKVLHRCKYLKNSSDGKTICAIYDRRVGKIIYKEGNINVYCIMREKSPIDYQGCPYNTGKPIGGKIE